MSADDRQNEQPEFPMRDAAGNPIETGAGGGTPPLPEIPAWQTPGETTPVDQASDESPADAEVVEVVEVVEIDSTGTDSTGASGTGSVEEVVVVDTATTREPLGGPYVVTESGAPVAEQAVAAYDRQPLGGPYVTASEPVAEPVAEPAAERAPESLPATPAPSAGERTPYPAAAFAPAAAAAAASGASSAQPGVAPVSEQYPSYQGVTPTPAPQPIAPSAPQPKGNRGGGSLIALLGTVAFAVVYAAVSFVVIAASVAGGAVPAFLSFLATAAFIVPVVVFAISLILIVLIVNRAGWWAYVLGGFLVAVLVYFAGIAGALIHVQAWNWQPQEQYDFVSSLVMDPLTLAGAIVAREVSVWTGAWIAARGRKVKAKNKAAYEEFTARRDAAESEQASQPGQPAPSTTW